MSEASLKAEIEFLDQHVKSLEAKLEMAREALGFYADETNFIECPTYIGGVARKALSALSDAPGERVSG